MSPFERGAGSGEVLDSLIGEIRPVFIEAGFEHVSIPIIQPADPFLDRLGEAFRGRIYSFDAPTGVELCLRPDFTIAAGLRYLQDHADGARPAKLCYEGPIFRHGEGRDWRESESHQAGAELIGQPNSIASDVEALDLALSALRRTGLRDISILFGDLALYSALLDAFELPQHWIVRLKRDAWRWAEKSDGFQQLATGHVPENAFLAMIGSLAPAEAREALRGALELGGIAPVGTRSPQEIVDRLLDQAAQASMARLPRIASATISAFLGIKERASDAADAIRRIAKLGGISIDGAINAWERRLGLIERQGIDISRATFATNFGASMDYYTGFLFYLSAPGSEKHVVAGGRYDTLLQALGAAKPIPAIGCAVYGERLWAARRAQGTKP